MKLGRKSVKPFMMIPNSLKIKVFYFIFIFTY